MIKFRQKEFTIQEGHFTGTKDEENLPSTLEVVGKSTIGGAIIGAIVGKIDKKSTIGQGAASGAKYGALTGVALKILINYLHKPMSKVKYQEIDKGIRREYGIYKAASIPLGDKLEKRATMEERFAFNDRNVCAYKVCFAVQDNKVTMYTNRLNEEEMDKLNKHLDYYCKKYYGMGYTSVAINPDNKCWAVSITFTNYQVISNFMIELSETLQTKINLLDNNALVKGRLEESQKSFSVKSINKYEALKILGNSGIHSKSVIHTRSFPLIASSVLINLISEACKELSKKDLANDGFLLPKKDYGNSYLEDTLKRLHYIEGFNYTISDKTAKNNISMSQGLFIITVEKDSNEMKKVDKVFWSPMKTKIRRSEVGKSVLYNYSFNSLNEFDLLIKKLMSTQIKFNIYEG